MRMAQGGNGAGQSLDPAAGQLSVNLAAETGSQPGSSGHEGVGVVDI